MWAPQRGRRNPSSDLVPRPPSPQGRRKKQFGFPLSLGERGTRKAEGAPRFACRGGEGSLPELSNFYCHPGRAGGPPYRLAREDPINPDIRRTSKPVDQLPRMVL